MREEHEHSEIISNDNNALTVPRLASSRISARELLRNIEESSDGVLVVDFSENEACSISFIQELVRIHLVLNVNMESVLVFRNVRQSTVEKVDYVFNSFPSVRKRIVAENVREG